MYPFIHYNFDQIYAPKLGRRAKTFRAAFVRLLYLHQKEHSDLTIVETGTINDPDNWSGHGQSTILFDKLTQTVGGHVFSVDNSPEAITTAHKLVSQNVTLCLGDSIKFLSAFKQPIDLLYLDSYDLEHANALPAAKHALLEFLAAAKNLRHGSIVCVDDTWDEPNEAPFGKGALLCECLKGLNAERITPTGGFQVGWMIK